jgi:hypothetical protein
MTLAAATGVFMIAATAGVINAIAGGATILTVPFLMFVGLDAKTANASNTLGLCLGSLTGAIGFRAHFRRTTGELLEFLLMSLVGGFLGAILLRHTSKEAFDHLVLWLILGATGLFAFQEPLKRWFTGPQRWATPAPAEGAVGDPGSSSGGESSRRWGLGILALQFLVGVYGGYFGAGIGILMLAILGFAGVDDLHERNGIKNLSAFLINGVAAIGFAAWGMVDWRASLLMATGAMTGAFFGARLARRLGARAVRAVVILIGVASTVWIIARSG